MLQKNRYLYFLLNWAIVSLGGENMKKTKTFILIVASAFLLMACRSNGAGVQDGKLPSGGEKTDLATSEGQEVMKTRLDAVSKAYDGIDLESVSFTSVTSGVNLNYKANLEMDQLGKINLEAGVKGFGAKVEMKAAKDGKNAKASVSAKTTGGNITVKGTIPGKEQGKTADINASLSLSGIEANAYLSGSKTYVDMSSKGNETFVKNAETFANKLMDQVNNSMFSAYTMYLAQADGIGEVYDAKTGHFNLLTAYNKYLPEKKIAIDGYEPVQWPSISTKDMEETPISVDNINEAIKALAQMKIGLELVTYKNDSFGLTASLDKESFIALLQATGYAEGNSMYTALPNMFTNLKCNVSAFFNKDNLLESVGFAYECDAKIDSSFLRSMGMTEQSFKAFDMSYSLKAEETVSIKYNGIDVKLPDFSDYKAVK